MSGIDYADLPIYRGELADAVGFSPADLTANRGGNLTSSQRASLLRDDRTRVAWVALSFVVAALCIVIPLIAGVDTLKDVKFLVFAVLFTIFGGMGIVTAGKLWSDVRGGTVSSVEGFITSTMTTDQSASRFYWVLGDERFSVSGDMYSVLAPGRYRLHFLPRTRRVMSIEPIANAGTGPGGGTFLR